MHIPPTPTPNPWGYSFFTLDSIHLLVIHLFFPKVAKICNFWKVANFCDHVKLPLNTVPFQASAKFLGVRLDQMLSTKEQVSSLCRSSYVHLHKMVALRLYLSDASTALLVSSLILSRLDYCNSTLSGLPMSSLK